MKEISDIIRAYNEAHDAGLKSALATVVKVEGSSYRRPGARMLITEDGRLTGAISGGCLEGDARRKALFALQQGKNRLLVYDSMEEEGELFGIQLGCNGIVHILLEPIASGQINHPLALLKEASLAGNPACLATLFQGGDLDAAQPGTCLLLKKGAVITTLSEESSRLLTEAKRVLENQTTEVTRCVIASDTYDALLDYIPPPVSLVVAGAGNDAMPLVRFANELGWQVTVVDGRGAHATHQRFPDAQAVQVVKTGDPLPAATAYVLLSHNYNYDLAALREAVKTDCAYIGILGPGKKRDSLLADLQEDKAVSPAARSKIFGPTGLDIGAETAEEIALSVIAEIKAVLAGRNGASLRDKEDFIHSRATA